MPKKRRLTDLYVVGQEVSFDDGQGEVVSVYVRKLNPVDHETALRTANAARSRAVAIKADHDSDEWQAMNAIVLNYDLEAITTYLVEDLRSDRVPVLEASTADEDEWKDKGYLQGLKDAWVDGLEARLAEDPEDVDAQRVKSELDRFDAAVQTQLDGEIDELREALAERRLEDVQEQVLDKILEVRASIAWLTEYRRCEVWLSTRDSDRKTRYFEGRQEVDELPAEVFDRLSEVYLAIAIEPTEGKDSAATPPSSPSSEQQAEQEMDESSGPKDAAA